MLTGLRIENNLYTQIGIILLIALSAKNAILIVEVALELHVRDRKPLLESAVEAARARFRPILMTSFAFILGVVPLVLATGAGANARKSIGITVFSGMLASTCLAVLFVPTFFVVVQRFENWLEGAEEAARPGCRQCRKRRDGALALRRPGLEAGAPYAAAPSVWHSASDSTCTQHRRGIWVPAFARDDVMVEPAYTLTIRLPRFSPASRPISAFGVFSMPSITSSCTFSLPEATQDCRSASAAALWSM